MNADKSDAFSGFLCAGGEGKEESCYVRNKTTVDYKRTLIENNFIHITSNDKNTFNNDLFILRLH